MEGSILIAKTRLDGRCNKAGHLAAMVNKFSVFGMVDIVNIKTRVGRRSRYIFCQRLNQLDKVSTGQTKRELAKQ